MFPIMCALVAEEVCHFSSINVSLELRKSELISWFVIGLLHNPVKFLAPLCALTASSKHFCSKFFLKPIEEKHEE